MLSGPFFMAHTGKTYNRRRPWPPKLNLLGTLFYSNRYHSSKDYTCLCCPCHREPVSMLSIEESLY
ncbi:unnamed protein product [Brassica napus]|uniref:(rape) hypothetical protein n=1 Tax=Brassica napus TaxID=3708 RepID=A0A816KXB3_BRANA|nr:unnamed protein product [Brassica napus]